MIVVTFWNTDAGPQFKVLKPDVNNPDKEPEDVTAEYECHQLLIHPKGDEQAVDGWHIGKRVPVPQQGVVVTAEEIGG